MKQRLFFAFLVLGIITFSCQEEVERPITEPDKGFLKGIITNEFGQPLSGASVEIDMGSSKYKTSTTAEGKYGVGGVLVGERSVSVSLESFIGQTKKIQIEKNVESILDFELKTGSAFLIVSDSVFQVQFNHDELAINIKSNSTWVVESDSDWILVSSSNGSGNGDLILTVNPNEGKVNRESNVWVTAGELKWKIRISQIAKATIINSVPSIGYINLGQSDSIRIEFNNPVEIVSIDAKFQFCSPNFPYNFRYSSDRKSVTFEYACGDPGQSYEFLLKFQDDHGNIFTEYFQTDFYDSQLVLEGLLHRSFFSRSENSIWILTYSKNFLYKIDLDDFSIEERFQLPEDIPHGFAINEFTNEIYLYYLGKSVMDVFDKDRFTYKRRIHFEGDPLDHPEHPVKYPYNLQFLSNGLGVLSLQSNSSSATRWKLLDSREGDKISTHPQSGEFGDNAVPEIGFIHHNYDHTKLYFMQGNRYQSFAVFDQSTDGIKIVRSNFEFYPVKLVPNRINNQMIFLQNYTQSIINPIAGEESIQFGIQSINAKGTDFTYHPSKPMMTYYYLLRSLILFDYSDGTFRETQVRFNDISDLFSSLNGDNLFLIKLYGNSYQGSGHFATFIYRVPTSYFYDF